MLHKFVIILMAIFVLFPAIALGDDEDEKFEEFIEAFEKGYKGVKWGATKKEFAKIRPEVPLDGDTKSKEKFYNYEAETLYAFRSNEKWFRMVIFLKAEDKEEFKKTMIRLYDEPIEKAVFLIWEFESFNIAIIDRPGAPLMIDGLVDGKMGPD